MWFLKMLSFLFSLQNHKSRDGKRDFWPLLEGTLPSSLLPCLCIFLLEPYTYTCLMTCWCIPLVPIEDSIIPLSIARGNSNALHYNRWWGKSHNSFSTWLTLHYKYKTHYYSYYVTFIYTNTIVFIFKAYSICITNLFIYNYHPENFPPSVFINCMTYFIKW